ncbi:MAG: BatA domain-containing protein [Bacteroidota bacterium]
MGFLYPSFLWALTAMAIPLIIHLFSFRRHKTVYFSQTRFLETVHKDSRSRTTLKQLLILISRMLAIAMLVLAFAQPVIMPDKEDELSARSQYVAVCIDNSYSMQNEGKSGSLLDIGKQKATEIAEAYGQDVQYFLITNDMLPRYYRPMPYDEFLTEISQVEVSPVSSKLSETIEKLRRTTDSYMQEDSPLPVYIISDYQTSTTDFVAFSGMEQYDMQAVLVSAVQQENLSIDSVWFDSPFRQAGKPEQLSVLIKNHGDQAYGDIPVHLKLNDSLRAVSSLNIEEDASTELTLNYTNPRNGIQRAMVELDDYPVGFDNRFYFTYQLNMQKSILLVNGRGAPEFPVSVYDDTTYFDLHKLEEDNLDLSVLSDFDMIIFNATQRISEGLAAQLKTLTDRGIAMVFIPGKDMHTGSWNQFMQNLRGPQFLAWDSTKQNLSGIAWEHPFFKGVFSDRLENADLPSVQGTYQMEQDQNSIAEDLISFENNAPFLNMISVDNALVYVFSGPLSKDHGSFVKHALFIPVAYNMAMNTPTSRKLFFTSGSEASLTTHTQTAGNETAVEIRSHTREEAIIPPWRIASAGVKVFVPSELSHPGHYDVFVDDDFSDAFALNIDPAESAMEFYDKDNLKAAADTRNFEFSGMMKAENLDITQKIKEKEEGKALWLWFLIAVLFFIMVEILLIKLM